MILGKAILGYPSVRLVRLSFFVGSKKVYRTACVRSEEDLKNVVGLFLNGFVLRKQDATFLKVS